MKLRQAKQSISWLEGKVKLAGLLAAYLLAACLLARHAFRLPMLKGLRLYQLRQGRLLAFVCWQLICWHSASLVDAQRACLLARRRRARRYMARCRMRAAAESAIAISTAAGASSSCCR